MRTFAYLMAATAAFAQSPCADLAKLQIPDLIVEEAVSKAAAGGLPDHCLVHGVIERRTGVDGRTYGIRFELRLPVQWQGRFLFQGGGGMDGVVRPAVGPASGADPTPGLARGFAVASTDAGHPGSPNDPTFSRDQQARIDNAYRSIDRVTAIAKSIIPAYYGRPWKRAYFDGCSNGGRQGLIAMQRLPMLFDGIVSGAPAFRVTRAGIDSAWATIHLTRIAPKDDAGKPILSKAFSEGDLKLVGDAVLEACDGLDGVKDGLVFSPCRYDPTPLTCKGSKTDACLSAAQVGALNTIMAGPKNSQGKPLYSDWPYDPGIASPGWRMLKLGTSATAESNAANITLMLKGLTGYFMTPFDPGFDPMKFDFDRDPAKVEETAALQDAEMTQVSSFLQHQGKLLLYHGMADPFFSALDTERYFERLRRDNAAQGDFARLFLVPGMTHCGGGPALDNFDALGAVVDWVERGKAPERLNATGKTFPGVSRPLCAFPKIPHYKGTGSKHDAGNFECR